MCSRSTALLALAASATASPFDPRPAAHAGPYFEGWFTRVIDTTAGRSWSVIGGSFQPVGASDYSSTWIATIVAGEDGKVITEQVFPEQTSVKATRAGTPVTSDPAMDEPAEFEWISSVGRLAVTREGASTLDFRFPSGLTLNASLSERVPWDPRCEGCGPEGWAGQLPGALLPTHYYVQSLGSKATYAVNGVTGQGFAHQETNYGAYFPSEWTWLQGVSSDGKTQVLLSGGYFTVAGISVRQFVVGYRSPQRSWDFRGIDLDPVEAEVDGCRGTLRVVATSLGRRFELNASAPLGSFSDPLYFPTSKGWSNNPGCIESYYAEAQIRIFDGAFASSPAEEVQLKQVALEFGGGYRCKDGTVAAEAAAVVV